MLFQYSTKIQRVAVPGIKKDAPQVSDRFGPEILNATEIYQRDAGVIIEEIIAPMRISMHRLELQHLEIEEFEEMRAELVPQFLCGSPGQELVQMTTGHK